MQLTSIFTQVNVLRTLKIWIRKRGVNDCVQLADVMHVMHWCQSGNDFRFDGVNLKSDDYTTFQHFLLRDEQRINCVKCYVFDTKQHWALHCVNGKLIDPDLCGPAKKVHKQRKYQKLYEDKD